MVLKKHLSLLTSNSRKPWLLPFISYRIMIKIKVQCGGTLLLYSNSQWNVAVPSILPWKSVVPLLSLFDKIGLVWLKYNFVTLKVFLRFKSLAREAWSSSYFSNCWSFWFLLYYNCIHLVSLVELLKKKKIISYVYCFAMLDIMTSLLTMVKIIIMLFFHANLS